MGESMQGEHCVLCGAGAAVRVRGTSFCASCGLEHYSAGRPDVGATGGRRRAVLVGLFSSGFLVKLLLGSVAIAAVGGVAASAVRTAVPADTAAVAVSTTLVATPSETTTAAVAAIPSSTVAAAPEQGALADLDDGRPAPPAPPTTAVATAGIGNADVGEFVAALQAWTDCVAREASTHSGGPFDPDVACPDRPEPGDYGLGGPDEPPGHDPDGPGNSENAPGHDPGGPGNSENAPGHDPGGPGNSENAPGKVKDRG